MVGNLSYATEWARASRLLLLFLFSLTISLPVQSQSNFFSITEKERHYSLNSVLKVLPNIPATSTIDSIMAEEHTFKAFDSTDILDPLRAHWGLVNLKNETGSKGSWVVSPDWETNVKRNGFVDFYFIFDGNRDSIIAKHTGRSLPYSKKEGIAKVFPNNQVRLDLADGQTVKIFIKVSQYDRKKPIFKVVLLDMLIWKDTDQDMRNIIHAFFQGIVWIMIFYALMNFWSQKNTTYIYYALFLFSTSVYFLYVSGILYETILREYPKTSDYAWILASNFLAIGYLEFCRQFLKTKERIPEADRIGIIFIKALAVLVILEVIYINITHNQFLLNKFNNLIILIEVTFLLGIGIYYQKRIRGSIRVFMWATLWIVIAGYVGVLLDFFHVFQDYIAIVLFFFVLQILTFTWGLGYRAYQTKKQALEAKVRANNAKELVELKNKFFADITHDFRSPISIILWNIKYLIKNNLASIKEEVPVKFDAIFRNAQKLLDLVNKILDLTKLQEKAIVLKPREGELVQFIKTLASSFETAAQIKKIRFDIQLPESELGLSFDPDNLKSIIGNLLSNALKYTPEGGNISLHFYTEEYKNQEYAIVSVKDSGPGILPEDLPYIFERFYQSKKNPSSEGGTGIGLALVKGQVELVGGEVKAENNPEGGAQFTIKWPIERITEPGTNEEVYAIAPPVWPNPSKKSQTKSKKQSKHLPIALIMEDNEDIITYLKSILSPYYDLYIARNGAEGIGIARKLVPDIIISDIMMPEKNGFEVCETLKTDLQTSHIPIILLTGRSEQADKIEGLEKGADAYLLKPVDEEELLTYTQNLIENRKKIFERSGNPSERNAEPVLDRESAIIQKARRIIKENLYNPDFTNEDLENLLDLNYYSYRRKLKALTDLTPTLFKREIQLEEAHHLLENTDKNVSEVAFDLNFKPAFFSRIFKEKYGYPPSDLKKLS
jgi:signal transduction histidine kinase/DNA-binding response OmpR family regulator